MLNGYIEQAELDPVDARLMIGVATKNPVFDDNKPPKPKVIMMKQKPTYSSGNLVEMALGVSPSPDKKKPKVRIDSASSSGLNDRAPETVLSPPNARQSPNKKTAFFPNNPQQSPRRTRSPRQGEKQVSVELTNTEELDSKTMGKLFRHLNHAKGRQDHANSIVRTTIGDINEVAED